MKKLTELLISEATEYEFKGRLETKKPKSWLKTVSAFSNGLGGSIYFGVNKDGIPEGLEDIHKDSETISQLVNAKIDPMVYINLTPYILENGIRILRLEVKPGMMTPYFYSSDGNKIAYVRLGEESVQAPSHILNELILKGQHSTFDAMVSKYEKTDFSFSLFEATYLQKVRSKLKVNDFISFGLADIFNRMRLMERRGSGIKKILKIYDGKEQPRFWSTETDFIITLYNLNYKEIYIKEAEKRVIGEQKQLFEGKKQLFVEVKQSIDRVKGSKKTCDNIAALYEYYQHQGIFGRKEIMEQLHISSNPAGELIKKMKDADLIVPVKGYGKGKYRFN